MSTLRPDHPFAGDPHDTGTNLLPCGDPCCIVCGHGDPNIDPWNSSLSNPEEDPA